MIYRFAVALVLGGMVGSSVTSNYMQAAQTEGAKQSDLAIVDQQLPICFKPEQPLDQESVTAVIEQAKKVITNYNLQIYKGLIFLKILVEKSQAVYPDSQKEVKDYIESIRLVDEHLRLQLYAYMINSSVKAYDLLCAIENKSKNFEIQQEDIEPLLAMIERLEKEKVLIVELNAIIKSEQESLDRKIEQITDGAKIE